MPSMTRTLNQPAASRPGLERNGTTPLQRRMAERLAEIKARGGLLPVCSWCRKARDEAGLWTPVDRHLLEGAGVPITHGLCPECSRTHFPRRPDAA